MDVICLFVKHRQQNKYHRRDNSRHYWLLTSFWKGQVPPFEVLRTPGSKSLRGKPSPCYNRCTSTTGRLQETGRTSENHQIWLRAVDEDVWPRTLEYTLPGERPDRDTWRQVVSTATLL